MTHECPPFYDQTLVMYNNDAGNKGEDLTIASALASCINNSNITGSVLLIPSDLLFTKPSILTPNQMDSKTLVVAGGGDGTKGSITYAVSVYNPKAHILFMDTGGAGRMAKDVGMAMHFGEDELQYGTRIAGLFTGCKLQPRDVSPMRFSPWAFNRDFRNIFSRRNTALWTFGWRFTAEFLKTVNDERLLTPLYPIRLAKAVQKIPRLISENQPFTIEVRNESFNVFIADVIINFFTWGPINIPRSPGSYGTLVTIHEDPNRYETAIRVILDGLCRRVIPTNWSPIQDGLDFIPLFVGDEVLYQANKGIPVNGYLDSENFQFNPLTKVSIDPPNDEISLHVLRVVKHP